MVVHIRDALPRLSTSSKDRLPYHSVLISANSQALLVAKVTSHPNGESNLESDADALGSIAQEIAVVLVLLPVASWITRYSYYNRVYFAFVDTTFLCYVVQPVLGLWCFYWATGLRSPVVEPVPEQN